MFGKERRKERFNEPNRPRQETRRLQKKTVRSPRRRQGGNIGVLEVKKTIRFERKLQKCTKGEYKFLDEFDWRKVKILADHWLLSSNILPLFPWCPITVFQLPVSPWFPTSFLIMGNKDKERIQASKDMDCTCNLQACSCTLQFALRIFECELYNYELIQFILKNTKSVRRVENIIM